MGNYKVTLIIIFDIHDFYLFSRMEIDNLRFDIKSDNLRFDIKS